MSRKLQDSAHRLGVIFASIVLVLGLIVAVTDLTQRASPMDMVQVGAYTCGIAALAYIVVRVVGWIFGEIITTTREHRARRN